MANVGITEELQCPNLVVIKSEPIECNVDIKVEPPDYDEFERRIPTVNTTKEGTDICTAGNGQEVNITVKEESSFDIEHITVKIEPTCYSSDSDDLDLASYAQAKSLDTYPDKPLNQNQRTRIRRRESKDIDEDYIPPKKKKKVVKEIVKKPYTNKAKKKENRYSDNVTQHIELVTITEEERQIEFRDLWQTRRHMRYFCENCAIGFVMEEPYLVHMKSHAPESGEITCDICRCRGDNKERMYKHRLRHYRRYRCAVCERVFKDKETVSSHVMSEHVHEAFLCGECGKGFRRPAYLKKHVAQQHTKGQRHECPICERVFFHRSMYNTHVRRHNEEVRNPVNQLFICDLCSKQLKSKQALRRHLAVHARTRNVACVLCPAMFHTKKGLRLHELNKHSADKERYNTISSACLFCSKHLKSKQALRRHLAVHARTRNVPCVLCPAMFHTKKGLRLHEVNKHSGDKERRMLQQCPQCERECTTPALLRQHIRRMHTDRTKKYQCDDCKRFYWSKGELRSHIVWSHAPTRGKRALFCCGREFRTRSRLKDHIAIHHLGRERERIYKCDQCDKAFANKQVLTRHKKSHSDCTYPCPDCGVRFKCEAYVKVHHQLKHLNMTRAEIKAMKQAKRDNDTLKPRVLNNPKENVTLAPNKGRVTLAPNKGHVTLAPNKIKGHVTMAPNLEEPQDLSMRSDKICFETVLVKQEVDSDCEISVPLFDLADLKGRV